jgi:hypothetical protein
VHNLRGFFRDRKRRQFDKHKFEIQSTLLSQKDSFDVDPVARPIGESLAISISCRIFPQPLKKPLHFHKTRRGTR